MIELDLEITGPARSLSEVTEENLLRISQEALTNVLKHAAANQVQIRLEFGPKAVILRIQDDGSGFAPENCRGSREGHFGLLGMSERAKRLNGSLRVTSSPGTGTCLEVEIPMKPTDETDKDDTTTEAERLI